MQSDLEIMYLRPHAGRMEWHVTTSLSQYSLQYFNESYWTLSEEDDLCCLVSCAMYQYEILILAAVHIVTQVSYTVFLRLRDSSGRLG